LLSTGSVSPGRGSRSGTTAAAPIRSRRFSRRLRGVPAELRSTGTPGQVAWTSRPELGAHTEDAPARQRPALRASRSDPRQSQGRPAIRVRTTGSHPHPQVAPATRDRPRLRPQRSSRRRRPPRPRPLHRRHRRRAFSRRSRLRSFPSYRRLSPSRRSRTCRRHRCLAFRRLSLQSCRETAHKSSASFSPRLPHTSCRHAKRGDEGGQK
jgi:hypothetical protein